MFHWISFSKISILVTWSRLCSIVFWIWTEGASMFYFNISLFVLFSQHPKIKWSTSWDVFSAEVESVETRRKTRGTWNLFCWSAHGALVQCAHSRDSAIREKRHIDLLQGFLCFTYLQYVHLFWLISVQKAFKRFLNLFKSRENTRTQSLQVILLQNMVLKFWCMTVWDVYFRMKLQFVFSII